MSQSEYAKGCDDDFTGDTIFLNAFIVGFSNRLLARMAIAGATNNIVLMGTSTQFI